MTNLLKAHNVLFLILLSVCFYSNIIIANLLYTVMFRSLSHALELLIYVNTSSKLGKEYYKKKTGKKLVTVSNYEIQIYRNSNL